MTRRGKILIALTGAALVAAAAGGFAFRREILPERSPAGRGRALATASGCFACHGFSPGPAVGIATAGAEGAARAPATRRLALAEDADHVPSLFHETDPKEAREWIEKGSRPRADGEEHAALVMPGYEGRLTSQELDELTAFVTLEASARRFTKEAEKKAGARGAGSRTSAPDAKPYARGSLAWAALMNEGERAARCLGCFTCHGELGQGGVSNPGSLKGYVPGFFGSDFDVLTRGGDAAWLRGWIVEGAPKEFLEQGALGFQPARWFMARQVIKMPAYAPLLLEGEADLLSDYITALRALGPLDAAATQDLRNRMKGTSE